MLSLFYNKSTVNNFRVCKYILPHCIHSTTRGSAHLDRCVSQAFLQVTDNLSVSNQSSPWYLGLFCVLFGVICFSVNCCKKSLRGRVTELPTKKPRETDKTDRKTLETDRNGQGTKAKKYCQTLWRHHRVCPQRQGAVSLQHHRPQDRNASQKQFHCYTTNIRTSYN